MDWKESRRFVLGYDERRMGCCREVEEACDVEVRVWQGKGDEEWGDTKFWKSQWKQFLVLIILNLSIKVTGRDEIVKGLRSIL